MPKAVPRMTADKLRLAADWLDCYEAAPGDLAQATMQEVARWLRINANRRDSETVIRNVAKERGLHVSQVRRAVKTSPTFQRMRSGESP